MLGMLSEETETPSWVQFWAHSFDLVMVRELIDGRRMTPEDQVKMFQVERREGRGRKKNLGIQRIYVSQGEGSQSWSALIRS